MLIFIKLPILTLFIKGRNIPWVITAAKYFLD